MSRLPPVRTVDPLFRVVVEGLVTIDQPGADEATIGAVADEAAAHAAGMPDLTRFGVRMTGALLVVACLLPARGHLSRLPAGRRGQVLARMVGLPLVGEYVRLARGVGLVCFYDRADGADGP